MKLWSVILFLSVQLSFGMASAFEAHDWSAFEIAMKEARLQDRREGVSYFLSGAIVSFAGFTAAGKAVDPGTKLIFGLSQNLGLAAMGYGIARLTYGNEYNSFHESLKSTELSIAQRDQLVRRFLSEENEKREIRRRIHIATHLAIGSLNLFSASKEEEATAKGLFQLLAGLNYALAFSYSF